MKVRTDLLEKYTPNTDMDDLHFVQLDFMCWEYKVSYNIEVGGNCRGLSILETAIEMVYEDMLDNNITSLVLKNNDGDELACDISCQEGLEEMLVGYTVWKLNTIED